MVFVRPVGFSAADSLRLMQAAQRISEVVRWRLAPQGVQSDIYLAHAHCVRYARASAPTPIASSSYGNHSSGHSSFYEHSQLTVDAQGWHNHHPVCVLGRASPEQQEVNDSGYTALASLVFPDALQELSVGLARLQNELISLRMLYALGRSAWEQRSRWKTHRLQLSNGARLLAVIEPQEWRIHLLGECTVSELEAAYLQAVPMSSGFAAAAFDILPLESALWEFAKRCPEGLLTQMVPSVYLSQRLTHRRHTQLSDRALGDHCVALLKALDTSSTTADTLQKHLRLTRPALLRALASLALIRAIHPEPKSRGVWGWLPRWWRRKVFGPSGLF